MGLSSSQGRLLMLTSRLNDIELQEIMISQRQNQLAWQSEKVAREYNEAMNNQKLVVKVAQLDSDAFPKGYEEQDMTYANLSTMGYILCDANGQIYLTKDDDGNWVTPKNLYGESLLNVNAADNTATLNGTSNTKIANYLSGIDESLARKIESINEDESIEDKEAEIAKAQANAEQSRAKYLNTSAAGTEVYPIVDATEYLQNSAVLQNQIMNGMLFVVNTNDNRGGLTSDLLESDSAILWELDTSDDAEAESKYNYETATIHRKENELDLELKQLETQHEAVLKEYDSVKQVISNNVDRTFKLFSDG